MIVVVVVEELSMTFTLIVLDIGRKASNHQSLSSQQSGKITQLKHSGDKQQHAGLWLYRPTFTITASTVLRL